MDDFWDVDSDDEGYIFPIYRLNKQELFLQLYKEKNILTNFNNPFYKELQKLNILFENLKVKKIEGDLQGVAKLIDSELLVEDVYLY